MKEKLQNIAKNFLAFIIGCFFAFTILETFFYFYDPLKLEIKNGEFVLYPHQPNIKWKRNNIGLRGPDYSDSDKLTRIFFVGGSTTICKEQNDGFSWPDLIASSFKLKPTFWFNNAGFSGHSTYAHIKLIEALKQFNPDYVIFLVGLNDIGRNHFNMRAETVRTIWNIWNSKRSNKYKFYFTFSRTNTGRFIEGAYASYIANKTKLNDPFFDINKLQEIPTDSINTLFNRNYHKSKFIPGYRSRVVHLIKMCTQMNVIPIFLTQPILYGSGIDSISGKNLAQIKMFDESPAFKDTSISRKGINGETFWNVLQLYNQTTKQVCERNKVQCINLAELMPKNSYYYYDMCHYTNEGCKKVTEIVLQELKFDNKLDLNK